MLIPAKFIISAGYQDISAVKALQLFDKKEYQEAEEMFRYLLEQDPDNTMLNYYYGACRTENGHFTDKDLNYLLKAGEKVTPQYIHYYLGIQYHARSNWEQALKNYNQLRLTVPEDEQNELKLAEKIQQCYDRINPYERKRESTLHNKTDEEEILQSGMKIVGHPEDEKLSKSEEKVGKRPEKETGSEDLSVTEPEKDIVKEPTEKPKSEQINTVEPEKEQEKITHEPDKKESKEDTKTKTGMPQNGGMTATTKPQSEDAGDFSIHRRALPDLPGVKPTVDLPEEEPIEFQINSQITYLYPSHFQTEKGKQIYDKLKTLKKQLDTTLEQADQLRKRYLASDDQDEKASIGEKIIALENVSYKLKEEINNRYDDCRAAENEYWENADKTEINNYKLHLKKIEAAQNLELQKTKPKTAPADTPIIIAAEKLLNVSKLGAGPGTVSKSSSLVYKIQIGAYSRGLPSYIQRLYQKLSLIRKIEHYTDENGVVVYTTGNLTNYEDAVKMKQQLKQEGVKDPQVVSYFNGKRISLERAKKIENQ
jgi:tetratricopeptide (TPR) repeat protein